MNCIQQRNPLAGFINQHSKFCHYCEEDAVFHYNVGYACGNVCQVHAKKFAVVERGTFVMRDDMDIRDDLIEEEVNGHLSDHNFKT